jgi:O-antigen/teichoic acid export membrane protein
MITESIKEQTPSDSPAISTINFDPSRQAFLNGCVSLAKGLMTVLVTVALTPFIVRHLGVNAFGVWSLLGLFITYVQLIDFGTSGAIAKFLGELSPKERLTSHRNSLVVSFLALVGIMALGAVVIAAVFGREIENGLSAMGLVGTDAKLFLVGVAALYSVGLVSNGFAYVLLGLHRYDVANYIAVSVLFAQAVGTVVVLKAGLGLAGMILLAVLTSGLSIIAYFGAARTLSHGLRFQWRAVNFQSVKKLLGLGIQLQAYALVGVYYFYAGKAIVSFMFPLAAVAAFEIALRIPILLRQAILFVLGPLMPAVSHMGAQGNSVEARTVMLRALRYSLILGAPGFIGTAVFAEPIIRLWVGHGFSNSITPLRILSIALGLSVFPDLIWIFLVGLGKQRFAVLFSLGEVILGSILAYVLAGRWGLAGVSWGVFVTSVLGAIVFSIILIRERILTRPDLPIALGCKVILVAAIASIIVLLGLKQFDLNYWNFSLAVLMAGGAYLLWLVKGGVLESSERDFLRRYVPSCLYFLC